MKHTYCAPEASFHALSARDIITNSQTTLSDFFDEITRDYVVVANDAWWE